LAGGTTGTTSEQPTSDDDTRLIQRSSDHFVRMIDVLFALVLGQAFIHYPDAVVHPFARKNLVLVCALLLLYYTVVRSFVAWHVTQELGPYRLMGPFKDNNSERYRLYLDLGIVVVYASMLFAAGDLVPADAHDSLAPFLIGFPLIFALYLGSGVLRQWAYDRSASRPTRIVVFLTLFTALCIAYVVLRDVAHGWFVRHGEAVNVSVLAGTLLLIVGFRWRWEKRRFGKAGG
jgi:hypothetical protein